MIKKIAAHINVALYLLLGADGLLRVLGWFLYPIIHWLEKPIFAMNNKPLLKIALFPLWVHFGSDTGVDIGNREECWEVVRKKLKMAKIDPIDNKWHRFLCAYYWQSFRNPAWNFYRIFNVDGKKTKKDVVLCERYYYDENGMIESAEKTEDYYLMKRAKFYYADEPTKISNEGDYVCMDKSFFGKSKVYFKIGLFWLVSYSSCFIRKVKGDDIIVREINYGLFSRILFRNKKQHRKLPKQQL